MSKMIYIQGIDGPPHCCYPAEGIEIVPGLYTIVKIEETLRLVRAQAFVGFRLCGLRILLT